MPRAPCRRPSRGAALEGGARGERELPRELQLDAGAASPPPSNGELHPRLASSRPCASLIFARGFFVPAAAAAGPQPCTSDGRVDRRRSPPAWESKAPSKTAAGGSQRSRWRQRQAVGAAMEGEREGADRDVGQAVEDDLAAQVGGQADRALELERQRARAGRCRGRAGRGRRGDQRDRAAERVGEQRRVAEAVPTSVFAGQVPAWKSACEQVMPSSAGLPPRSFGRVTCARCSPASSIVCAIVVESSTASVLARRGLTSAVSSGVNGSAPQLSVVKVAWPVAAWSS